jgi:8-oxo-dGTP pyrophosphatase MutT (NUDIX family)
MTAALTIVTTTQGAVVIERVRAIVVTPASTLLVIKRTRPGAAPYWVLPGGHADDTDHSLEDALRRELREELGGDATILRLVDVLHRQSERQYFYLATIDTWSFDHRTGPEFGEAGRGSYELEEIPSDADAIAAIELKPDEIARFLVNALRSDGGLAALPDLRQVDRGAK